jgi:hypothetical protein
LILKGYFYTFLTMWSRAHTKAFTEFVEQYKSTERSTNSMNTESQYEPSGMSPRMAHRLTIEMAWAYFLPWAEQPTKLFVSTWLNRCEDRWQVICDLIEEASADEDVVDPVNWVWAQLRRRYPYVPHLQRRAA